MALIKKVEQFTLDTIFLGKEKQPVVQHPDKYCACIITNLAIFCLKKNERGNNSTRQKFQEWAKGS